MTWDTEHGCNGPGTVGNSEHLGDPLTVAEISELEDGAEVTITWSGGNGPHAYRILVDRYGTRRVETCYADALLTFAEQRVPIHRVTRGWSPGARAAKHDRFVHELERAEWARLRGATP